MVEVLKYSVFPLFFIKRTNMLQDEILKISEYFRGIEYYNDALIVKIVYPRKWHAYGSKDELIKIAVQNKDTSDSELYYYGDMNKVSLDDIFGLINETIAANKDAEMKVHLLNTKITEMQELFKITPYEKLATLKFTFDEQTEVKKTKRKYTKRKKKEEKNEEIETVSIPVVTEENSDIAHVENKLNEILEND